MEIDSQFKRVQEKLQQLVKTTASLKRENLRLQSEIIALKQKQSLQLEENHGMREIIQILKASSDKMEDGDQKEFEKHINQYIREIDHCIGILSE